MIGSLNNDVHPYYCANVLAANAISSRTIPRHGDLRIEVRLRDAPQALTLIASRIGQVRYFKTRPVAVQPGIIESAGAAIASRVMTIVERWQFTLVSIFHLLLTFPLAWLFVSVMTALQLPTGDESPLESYLFVEHYWTTWRGLFLIALLLIWLRADRRNRKQKSILIANAYRLARR
jgi:hypothetical protein